MAGTITLSRQVGRVVGEAFDASVAVTAVVARKWRRFMVCLRLGCSRSGRTIQQVAAVGIPGPAASQGIALLTVPESRARR